jgi:hypothetical protein
MRDIKAMISGKALGEVVAIVEKIEAENDALRKVVECWAPIVSWAYEIAGKPYYRIPEEVTEMHAFHEMRPGNVFARLGIEKPGRE